MQEYLKALQEFRDAANVLRTAMENIHHVPYCIGEGYPFSMSFDEVDKLQMKKYIGGWI